MGSAAGVYWIGTTADETGSFWATLAGSALGFGAPGATVGFNLTRRYRVEPPPPDGLVNVTAGTVRFSVPAVSGAFGPRHEILLLRAGVGK